ncbi:cytochrome c [bacterium]|nr:cytochrome c [bacterium]
MVEAEADVARTLDSLFGTPNAPKWPKALLDKLELESPVDFDNLKRAAGRISSEQDGTHLGLFREHCVVCHGVAGSGAGPASQFQDPYPRDFRHGVFKWKSTKRASKPTREDLEKLLQHGVSGTGMPSFSLLASEDVDALVDYVIYLSIRGEVERRLLVRAVSDLDYGGEVAPGDEHRLTYPASEAVEEVVEAAVKRVVKQWVIAADEVVQPTDQITRLSGDELRESIDRGKAWFHGPIANCVGCHGVEGNGRVETLDYDDWTKEYTTRLGLTPTDQDSMQPFRNLGALTPRPIVPRNLQVGVFRSGDDASRLYRLITQGISGTPMPGVLRVDEENGKGLTETQVWDLVRYLQSFGSESL